MRPKSARLAIVFGISGVGKTYMVGNMETRSPPFVHFQASQLLRSATELNDEALRTATPTDISSNQLKLRDALENAWPPERECIFDVILDAHSVIDNDKTLVPIEIEPIIATRPDGLIFLWDDPGVIIDRRSSDTRSRPLRSVEQIKRYQELARETCRKFATLTDLILLEVKSGNHWEFRNAISIILDR